ncbi:alpha/beta fold hydrolase [Saccharopolyspora shandongensis]|uniref:alpha/beta fold hydrolase n=1 Tax=Saccharopolyspora shandongensis TaxID=418495 RepID=UPI0033FE8DDB
MNATAEVRHLFVESQGLRLHALDFGGSGRPILLLHGVTGHGWLWSGVAPGLTGFGRVVAVDFRGHGDSQWSHERAYATSEHATDVRTVIDAFGVAEVDVVGLSWGGLVGTRLAARFPGLVRRLAVLDVPMCFTANESDVPPRPADFPDHAAACAWERAANPNAPGDLIEALARHGTRPGPLGRLERKHDPHFLQSWPFRADDLRAEFRSLRQPVLLVRGDESAVLSREAALEMAGALPHARLTQLAECGHLVPVEAPGPLTAVLRDFLS